MPACRLAPEVTLRVAIANSRLIRFDDSGVTFKMEGLPSRKFQGRARWLTLTST